MRVRGPSTLHLALLASTCLAVSSCALKPVESPPAASSRDDSCSAPNPLHVVASSEPKREVDPDIESLLAQPAADPRLMQINRRMYQSLLALDVELRRQRAIASCKQPAFESPMLEVNTASGAGSAASAPSPSLISAAAASGSGNQMSSLHKGSVPPSAAGGNGATAPKIVPGSDNDIVARRLRRAAEQETDPALRAKLWKEYRDYQQGTAAAK